MSDFAKHESAAGGMATGDGGRRGVSVLEDRYRAVLRVLPASYRTVWEEEMVSTFLESTRTGDPDDESS